MFCVVGLVGMLLSLGAAPGSEPARSAPVIVAHRGLFKHAPENTVPAFAACLELRCGFELDVRRTKDGHLICLHDDDLRRTTDGAGKVADFTLAHVRRLDAGSRFDSVFRGTRVPLLSEVFALLKDSRAENVLVALDVKIDDDDLVKDIVALAEKFGVTRKLVCIGNTITMPAMRRRFREAHRQIGVAVLAHKAEDMPAALADKDADWIYIRFLPTAEQSARMHAAGKRIFLVGPLVAGNEPENWRSARAAGVDAILTDYPLACREAWRRK